MLLVIIVTLIKSFYITIDYIEVTISFIAILLGVFIQIIVKIKQIKGGKYEE
jgi:hypothetical protein